MARGVALEAARIARLAEDSAEVAEVRAQLTQIGAEIPSLVLAGGDREALEKAVRARDAAQRRLLRIVGRGSGARSPIDVRSFSECIEEDEALVSFWRYSHWAPASELDEDRLLAFVLRKDRGLHRFDLGPMHVIERAIVDWRSALMDSRDRGVSRDELAEGPERKAGRELRRLIFDPLLPALDEVTRATIALDDLLHLVPFDALPLDDETRLLGDWIGLRFRPTLRELLIAGPEGTETQGILVMGDIEYDEGPSPLSEGLGEETGPTTPRLAISRGGPPARAVRSGAWSRAFLPLVETGTEAKTIARLYARTFGDEAPLQILSGSQATKAAFLRAAPTERFIHLATHGYFAPESIASTADRDVGVRLPLASRSDQIRGLSPLVLCGLAFAGANLEPDAYGRIPGILTAEEITVLDLTGCELVVLSACETNVGVRRAGQGIASLQKALHLAGARAAITSLWKVPDAATRELMSDFYRRLWREKKAPAAALWEAKQRLRSVREIDGRPRYATRDWAGWVLTGEGR